MAKVWLILVLFIAVFVKQFEIQQTEAQSDAQILVENLDSILGNNDTQKQHYPIMEHPLPGLRLTKYVFIT